MSDSTTPENRSEIADELRNLGDQLKEIFRSAWESDERKKLSNEIDSGLKNLSDSLKQASDEFSQSPSGQNLKSDLQDFQNRLKTGEVENQLRNELLTALRTINEQLKKVSADIEKKPPTNNQP